MPSNNRKACAYCGRQTNMSTDECENCGSTTFESLKQAELHQEEHRKFNEQRGYPQQSYFNTKVEQAAKFKTKNVRNVAIAVILIVIILFGIIFFTSRGPKETEHPLNSTIRTDWFQMTVYEGKIIRTKDMYCGVKAPEKGFERVLVDLNLTNHTDENLDMNVADDFYLEAGGVKYLALNSGGSYSIFDRLSTDGMFFGQFMVSPSKQLHGYVAFDIPEYVPDAKFVYVEYAYDGDVRTEPKHYYIIDLEYEMPNIPAGPAQEFYDKAYNDGYILEIINDYDGFETFWIGAHKYIDESSKGITAKPEPVYWIDLTKDTSIANAKVEYNRFVGKVKAIGGTEQTAGSSAGTYQLQMNTSSTKFGIAYRVNQYNYLVESAPIEYKTEILEFLNALNLEGQDKT